MAITSTHYDLFRRLPLPRGGTLLEIGEANWHGDSDPARIAFDYPEHAEAVEEAIASRNWFRVVKAYYAAVFAPSATAAIDFGGTEQAHRFDLNQPVPENMCGYDVVINHGTAEHIFNVAQVFQTMHNACIVSGLMIHDAPFTGWIDHGFYCLQPTLFFDVAAANNYEVVFMAAHDFNTGVIVRIELRDVSGCKFPDNAQLFVCFRKLFDQPFRIPMQGFYARAGRGAA